MERVGYADTMGAIVGIPVGLVFRLPLSSEAEDSRWSPAITSVPWLLATAVRSSKVTRQSRSGIARLVRVGIGVF